MDQRQPSQLHAAQEQAIRSLSSHSQQAGSSAHSQPASATASKCCSQHERSQHLHSQRSSHAEECEERHTNWRPSPALPAQQLAPWLLATLGYHNPLASRNRHHRPSDNAIVDDVHREPPNPRDPVAASVPTSWVQTACRPAQDGSGKGTLLVAAV
jgi:hypothetical protein